MADFASLLHEHTTRLTLWSVTCVVLGGLGVFRDRRAGWRAFWSMNALWGIANLLLTYGLSALSPAPNRDATRLFLAFNLGLDLGYVGVGMTLVALGKGHERRRGSGWAVALQGAALLALDGWLLAMLSA